ncbi:MAG: transcriptional regulator [Thermoproteota archaeon]
MEMHCECMVKYVIPALRMLISGHLVETYNLNQVQVANLLNVTQPSISNYMGRRKGSAKIRRFLNNSIVKESANRMAKKLFEKGLSLNDLGEDICGLCVELRKSGYMG